ncbi:unnamed protein product [Hymenolepis diminuta]|uniref:Uncharacterized protein n=1 Tax=Hymenolepis diminuta TaxID=6216 RepID=A0A564YZM6_HYMDI|nr:unnamed protein product [Hymenolepis diminuta]
MLLGCGRIRGKSCWNDFKHKRFYSVREISHFCTISDRWVQLHAIVDRLN